MAKRKDGGIVGVSLDDVPARPPFTKDYPRDPELDRLVDAFARGNHRFVRREAEILAAKTKDDAIAAAARDLRARLEPDKIAYVLLGTTAALLLALTWWALRQSHDHRALPAPPPPKTVQTIHK